MRTWAVEFGQTLPAGVSCEFRAVGGLKDAAGQPLTMAPVYRFNTGGPWVEHASVLGGNVYRIDEEAVFVVRAAGDVDFATVEKNAWCQADGIPEAIPVTLLKPAELKKLAEASGYGRDLAAPRTALLRCARRLPNGAKVVLHWGAGIKGSSGLVLSTALALQHKFHVRDEFSVVVSCQRENAKSGCHPF